VFQGYESECRFYVKKIASGIHSQENEALLSDTQSSRKSLDSNEMSQAHDHFDFDDDDDDDAIDEDNYDADDDDNEENVILKQNNMKHLQKEMKKLTNFNLFEPTQSNQASNKSTQISTKQISSNFCKCYIDCLIKISKKTLAYGTFIFVRGYVK